VGEVELTVDYATRHDLDQPNSLILVRYVTRFYLAAYVMTLCLSVCLSVCLSQAGVLSKRLNRSGWYSTRRLPSAYPTLLLCFKEIWVPSKQGYFPLEHCPTLNLADFFRYGMSTDTSVLIYFDRRKFLTLSVHICLQQRGREAQRLR